jgi:hypothetical protein
LNGNPFPFYRRFGFETAGEAPVLGVSNFFMRRPANMSSDPHLL